MNAAVFSVAVAGACASMMTAPSLQEAEVGQPKVSLKPVTAPAPDSAVYPPWGFDLSGMNPAITPGDDFFCFTNGGWVDRTDIPPDKSSHGMLDVVVDRTRQQVRLIVAEIENAQAPAESDTGRIRDFYRAFMDEARIERLDAEPISSELEKIRSVWRKEELAGLMGAHHGGAGASFFRLSVGLDDRAPSHYALAARQSGLTLPGRDYYLESRFAAKKAELRTYVGRMLAMAGWPDTEAQAEAVVRLETAIAEASWSIPESQQLDRIYNPVTPDELQALAPGFPWREWLDGAGVGDVDRIIVRQITAFPRIARVFAQTELSVLKAWQAFRVIDQAAPYLSRRFADAHFDFHGKQLRGQLQELPRWQRGVDLVSATLGELIGKHYVARHFPASSKAAIEELTAHLRLAFERRIAALRWMTPATKRRALEKLAALRLKLGYPSRWRDYSELRIDAEDLLGNIYRSRSFEWARERAKIGRPADPEEWQTTPQTVNAFYDQTRNEIVVPAAILQAPFFDPHADMAVNFGAIGGVIGHEMTHGFDSQGRKTDAEGRLVDWWRPEDAARFESEAAKLGAQYEAFSVAPGHRLNGAQTMSENIADLGGLLLALDGYKSWLGSRPAPVRDGFSGEQRVFLGWAHILRAKIRPEALVRQVAVDPHSPDRFRVIGPARNIDAWYRAWRVTPRDKNYLPPRDRVRIW
jgi:putative endopeptidase